MRKFTLTCALFLAVSQSLSAQTLFTFGKKEVPKDEFLRVYKKNAINQKPEYTQKALQEYLDLYSLFRMKVAEAENQKLDTVTSIQYELDNYRAQLARNYLTDEEVTNRLVQEAYERSKENVSVAHILILSSPMAPAKDTVEPYRIIDSIYHAIVDKKADFDKLAAQYSADTDTKDRGGKLGYITALQTAYAFENAAYTTPVGKISKPFRSQLGYHIVKVLEKKQALGQVQVAHILLAAPKSKGAEGEAEALARAKQVHAELKKGADFFELVKKYSDDKYTEETNGKIERFGVGEMVPEFENAAFALKKPGDYSEPVKTEYGYHIVYLVQKYPLKPFDSVRMELKAKIDKDTRAEVARTIFYNNIKQKNGYKEYKENLDELKKWFAANVKDTGRNANTFSAKDFKGQDKPVFEIKGVKYKQSDALAYAEKVTRGKVMGPKEVIFQNIYDNYTKTVLNDIEEENLMNEKPEFRNLMTEYRDGIMLFELMDRNVWSKATKDTTGLKEFYNNNKTHYMWKAGFRGTVYTFKNEEAMKAGVKALAKKDIKEEELMRAVNNDKMPDGVSIEKGYYEFEKFSKVPKDKIAKGKASDAVKNADGTYTVVYAQEVFTTENPKTLDEARGYVIAEYQDYLEKTWNAQLRSKYPVKVNQMFLPAW